MQWQQSFEFAFFILKVQRCSCPFLVPSLLFIQGDKLLPLLRIISTTLLSQTSIYRTTGYCKSRAGIDLKRSRYPLHLWQRYVSILFDLVRGERNFAKKFFLFPRLYSSAGQNSFLGRNFWPGILAYYSGRNFWLHFFRPEFSSRNFRPKFRESLDFPGF